MKRPFKRYILWNFMDFFATIMAAIIYGMSSLSEISVRARSLLELEPKGYGHTHAHAHTHTHSLFDNDSRVRGHTARAKKREEARAHAHTHTHSFLTTTAECGVIPHERKRGRRHAHTHFFLQGDGVSSHPRCQHEPSQRTKNMWIRRCAATATTSK